MTFSREWHRRPHRVRVRSDHSPTRGSLMASWMPPKEHCQTGEGRLKPGHAREENEVPEGGDRPRPGRMGHVPHTIRKLLPEGELCGVWLCAHRLIRGRRATSPFRNPPEATDDSRHARRFTEEPRRHAEGRTQWLCVPPLCSSVWTLMASLPFCKMLRRRPVAASARRQERA